MPPVPTSGAAWAVTSADPEAGRLELRGPDGSTATLRPRWSLAPTGGGPSWPARAGVARPVRLGARIGLTYHLADPDPDATRDARMRLLRDGYVGIAPVAGGRVNVGIVLGRSWRAELRRRGGRAVADEIVAGIPPTADDTATWRGGSPCDPVAGAWPLGHRVTRRAGTGWLLIGDAAGFLDPFTGEGLHRGLVSAELATAAIRAAARGRTGAFSAYERAMERRFLAKDAVSALVQLFLGPARAVRVRRPADRDPFGRPGDDGPRDGRPRRGRAGARSALPRRVAGALMRSTIGIDVNAPPELVFALASDVERWERLLPHYARSRAVARAADGSLTADFIARRPFVPVLGLGVPVTWRARTWNDPRTRCLRFVHVAGATKGMDVTWRIEPAGGGTHITIEHDFRPRLPGFAALVDRAFTQPIASRTLATFKALAEALADAPLEATAHAVESARAGMTNASHD